MIDYAVIDSSVVSKWLHAFGEDHVEAAVDLLRAHISGDVMLVAPSHMPAEISNSLRWKKDLGVDVVDELISDLEAIEVGLFQTTYGRIQKATALAYRHATSVYDALFLALAEELDCPLVTADRRAFEGIDTSVEIRLL
jgi:predicted nucleic acid-binding protein